MILLVSPSEKAAACARHMQASLGERVLAEPTLRHAEAALRGQEFSAVVMDEMLYECEPRAAGQLLGRAGTAAPVLVNLAICGQQRVLRAVRLALQRRERERKAALRAARTMLWNELNGAVTGILLSSELALQAESLPGPTREKLKAMRELAQGMRGTLQARAAAS